MKVYLYAFVKHYIVNYYSIHVYEKRYKLLQMELQCTPFKRISIDVYHVYYNITQIQNILAIGRPKPCHSLQM